MDGLGERVEQRRVGGELRKPLLVELAREQQAADVGRQLAVACDVERRQLEPHRLEHVDVLEGERLERRAPGDGQREAGGGRRRRQQPAWPAGQIASAGGGRVDLVDVQIGGRLGAEPQLAALGGPGAELADAGLCTRVLAHELLGELRRDPAQYRQTGLASDDRGQLGRRTALVAPHDDRARELDAAGQRPQAAHRRRGGRPRVARVDDEHHRRVVAFGDVDRAGTP